MQSTIRQAPAFFIRAPKSDDLRVAVAEMLGTMRKAGVSEENLRMLPDSIEQALTLGGRAICGNVGLSYTGEWECTAKVQRIRCK